MCIFGCAVVAKYVRPMAVLFDVGEGGDHMGGRLLRQKEVFLSVAVTRRCQWVLEVVVSVMEGGVTGLGARLEVSKREGGIREILQHPSTAA